MPGIDLVLLENLPILEQNKLSGLLTSQTLFRTGKQFVDPDFPPADESLYGHLAEGRPGEVRWLRPMDIDTAGADSQGWTGFMLINLKSFQ